MLSDESKKAILEIERRSAEGSINQAVYGWFAKAADEYVAANIYLKIEVKYPFTSESKLEIIRSDKPMSQTMHSVPTEYPVEIPISPVGKHPEIEQVEYSEWRSPGLWILIGYSRKLVTLFIQLPKAWGN